MCFTELEERQAETRSGNTTLRCPPTWTRKRPVRARALQLLPSHERFQATRTCNIAVTDVLASVSPPAQSLLLGQGGQPKVKLGVAKSSSSPSDLTRPHLAKAPIRPRLGENHQTSTAAERAAASRIRDQISTGRFKLIHMHHEANVASGRGDTNRVPDLAHRFGPAPKLAQSRLGGYWPQVSNKTGVPTFFSRRASPIPDTLNPGETSRSARAGQPRPAIRAPRHLHGRWIGHDGPRVPEGLALALRRIYISPRNSNLSRLALGGRKRSRGDPPRHVQVSAVVAGRSCRSLPCQHAVSWRVDGVARVES